MVAGFPGFVKVACDQLVTSERLPVTRVSSSYPSEKRGRPGLSD